MNERREQVEKVQKNTADTRIYITDTCGSHEKQSKVYVISVTDERHFDEFHDLLIIDSNVVGRYQWDN